MIKYIIYMSSYLLSISLLLTLLAGVNSWCTKHYFTIPANPNIMQISPDNTYMAITTTAPNRVYVYDLYNYNRLLEYNPSPSTATTAKFSIDGNYLAVVLSNKSIVFLSGGPTFNQTIKYIINTANTINDIDFSPNGNKLLVCYTSNSYDVYSNYLNASSNINTATTAQVKKCKFTKNDSIAYIDAANGLKIIGSAGAVTTNCAGTTYTIFDIKMTTGTIKFIAGGASANSYYGNDPTTAVTINSYSPLTVPGSGVSGVACYAGDGQYYTFANTGNDKKVYIFADNNTLYDIFGNVNANLLSCEYTHNGQYLYVGAQMTSSLASIFVYKKNCYECPLGYYLSASTTCSPCNTLSTMTFCASCSNSTTCTNCYPGYYLNLTTRLCIRCNLAMPGCQTCIDSGTCVECAADFFPNSSNVCQSCSSKMNGCLTCNTSSNCLVCMPEYYNLNGTCTLCNNSQTDCFRCFNQTYCLECKEGYYVNSTKGCAVCSSNCTSCDTFSYNCTTCVRGFYISSSACVPCTSNCLECNSTNYCLDCKVGSYITPGGNCSLCSYPCNTCNSTNCITCYIGAYLSNGNCINCIGNCSTCISASNCSSCSFGFYLRTSDNTCQSCTQVFGSCSSCNSTACYSCLLGYYLLANNTCGNCPIQGCLICNSSSICQSCALGYYLTATNTCITCNQYCDTCYNSASNCSSCIPGYYISGFSCIACDSKCLTCNSTICYTCSSGYYLSSGQCVHCRNLLYGCSDCYNSTHCNNCDVGKYLTASNTCLDCGSTCAACNLTSCISCNVGYYLSSGNCLKCMDNCSECYSGSNCSSCSPGYFFDAALTTNQCKNCWMLSRGCLSCNQTSCFNCQIGYYLNSGDKLCYLCKDSITNCLQCIGNANCIACSQGFYLNSANSSCLACSTAVNGCEICSNSTQCSSCSVGTYLTGSTCNSCPSKCLTCNSTSCLTCAFRFIMNTGDCRNCDSLINHCQVCNSTSNCLQCYEGFYLSSGACLSCQNQVQGCAFCNSSSVCTGCLEGYFLSSGTCKICSVSEGCRLCTGLGACSACYSGYTVSGGACVLCSSILSNCIFCSNSSVCLQCSGGYHLSNGVCVSCGVSMNKCISCYNYTKCTQCEGGHYLNNSICEPCTVNGCQLCNAIAPGNCVNCYSGYYLSSGNCYQCNMTGCVDCNSSSVCISCDSGYYITPTGCKLCSSVMSGCSRCSSGTICTSCQTLFYLSANTCLPCSKALPGCAFCVNQTACLSCNSGYYLNASSLCSLCTTITGCILCRDISTCLYCVSGYYLSGGNCLSCSAISNCSDCTNNATCTSCISGFALTGGLCVVAQTSGSASAPSVTQTTKLKWKTYFVSDSELKHVLLSVGMVFQRPNIDLKVSSKISLKNKTISIPLTINRFEWGRPYQIIFYTNNPLSIQRKTLPFKRLLIGQSFDLSLDSSFEISQPILAQLLPNLLNDQAMILGYSLDNPQFYASLVFAVYNTYYYVIGLALTCILFVNYLIKALCTVPHSNNHGYIIGHLFAMKTISISLYPTFGEYINYCYGFMMADMPWLNAYFGYYMSDASDSTPLGYSIYYSNMSIFSIYLLPLFVFAIIYAFAHYACGEKEEDKFKLQKTTSSELMKRRKNRSKALKQFITNFFYFGMIFAGCASLQGSILNPRNMISINGVGYTLGIVIYVILIADGAFQFYKHSNFQRIRLIIKATLLSLAHFNPIYIFAAAITIDLSFIVLLMKMKYKYLLTPKTYLAVNILSNFALSAIFYFPDSFFSIYLSAGCIGLIVLGQFYTHYIEKNIRLDVYPFASQQEIVSEFEKVKKGDEAQWKINMEDYSLEKLNLTHQNIKDKDMIHQQKFTKENPIIFEQPNDMATTKFSQMKSTKQSIQQNPKRQRRFREANKTKTTILSSSLTSLQI